jgi:hypothetical protein
MDAVLVDAVLVDAVLVDAGLIEWLDAFICDDFSSGNADMI